MYELIIIGGGPGGLTAAIYAARYKMNALVLSRKCGGTAAEAYKICNFPTYEECTGMELMKKLETQVKHLGIEIKNEEVSSIKKNNNIFELSTKNNNYSSKKVIYAVGTQRRRLGVKNEVQFLGKGVSYCAICEAPFFVDKTVAVIGGSDAALTTTLMLSNHAKKVYIIYRKDHFFRAEPSWIELVEKNEKIESIFSEEVEELQGEVMLEKAILKSGKEIELDGLFVEIGAEPNNAPLKDLNVETTEKGYVKTDKDQKTNIPGLFAAGDITDNPLKQIITAAGQGATAAYTAYKEVTKEE